MTSEQLHGDRARAESFGGVAEQYDRFRPTSSPALLDTLAARHPERVLDVACGTGKTAVALAERGLDVLGVELDERMAAVARSHGVPVEVAPFETWDDAGRRFDLITCTSGWHWIDPHRGVRKAATLLRPGGAIARFWNYYRLDGPTEAAFGALYQQLAPEAHPHGAGPRTDDKHQPPADPFETDPAFDGVENSSYRWEQSFTADEWVGLVATYSDHQRLPAAQLQTVQQALREWIGGHGGVVHAHGESYLGLSTRV